MSAPNPSVAVLTLSFSGDFELCRLLCETVDRFVPPSMPHFVAVPRVDLPLFQPLANARRQLLAQEEFVPPWLHRIPMPSPPVRRMLRLPRRNHYVTRSGRFVRGWLVQQMMKLAAAKGVEQDVILHADSDAAFVRPITPGHLVQDGRVRLLLTENAGNTPMHHPWHRAASSLLGLPAADFHGADYIGNFVTWRRPLVSAMLERICATVGRDPFEALSRTPDFAEYVLYGVFVERVIGLEASGHFPTSRLLCATVWPGLDRGELGTRLAGLVLDDDQVAVGIQSTIALDIATRRAVIERLTQGN